MTPSQMTPEAFCEFLRKENLPRAWVRTNPRTHRVEVSDPRLQFLANFCERDDRDYSEHEGVFFWTSQVTREPVLLSAFVHRTCRGNAQGGTRFWNYNTLEALLRDGLRLSKGMTHKNSLAGLNWGGGKGVISRPPSMPLGSGKGMDGLDPVLRSKLFAEYGQFVSSLRGCYVTAEDVGVSPADVDQIFSQTRFVTCIPQSKGGSGNPSHATARGVACAMETAYDFRFKKNLKGITVAVQGLGQVASFLIEELLAKGVGKIIATDLFDAAVDRAKTNFKGKPVEIRKSQAQDASILFESVDVVAPCAVGAILNSQTIPRIQAPIICGAANNQLEDPKTDDMRIHERGLIYVPDFLVNRMGIVSCADEQSGSVDDDPEISKHFGTEYRYSIVNLTRQVLRQSEVEKTPTGATALRMAETFSRDLHPILGHRGIRIIESLVNSGWHRQ